MKRASLRTMSAARLLWLSVPIALLATATAAKSGAAQELNAEAATASPVIGVTVRPGVFIARALAQKQLSAHATLADGAEADVTAKVRWSSSDSAVASVGNGARGGLVETLGVGQAQITAADSAGHSASALIIVTAELVALEITPGSLRLRGGTGRSLGVRGRFSDGAILPLRKVVRWSSSDERIAAVSNAAGKVGMVVGGNVLGTATVTATANGATPAKTLSAAAEITVDALLTSFTLRPKSLNLRIKSKRTRRLTALGSFSDGARGIDITRFVDFASSNPAVAVARNRPRKDGAGIGAVAVLSKGTTQVTARSSPTGIASDNAVSVRVR